MGPEHPIEDLADDRFLAPVVGHPVLPCGVRRDALTRAWRRRSARGRRGARSANRAACGGGPPPGCRARRRARCARGSIATSRRCSCQPGSRRRSRNPTASSAGHVRRLGAGIGDGHVDVDDRLGRQTGDAGRARRARRRGRGHRGRRGCARPAGRTGPATPGPDSTISIGRARRVGADPLDAVGIAVDVAGDLLGGRHRRASVGRRAARKMGNRWRRMWVVAPDAVLTRSSYVRTCQHTRAKELRHGAVHGRARHRGRRQRR